MVLSIFPIVPFISLYNKGGNILKTKKSFHPSFIIGGMFLLLHTVLAFLLFYTLPEPVIKSESSNILKFSIVILMSVSSCLLWGQEVLTARSLGKANHPELVKLCIHNQYAGWLVAEMLFSVLLYALFDSTAQYVSFWGVLYLLDGCISGQVIKICFSGNAKK